MESRFTAFLIPVLIATLVYLLFFVEGDDKKSAGPAPSQDVMASDPEVQTQEGAQKQNPYEELDPVRHTFGALGDEGFTVTWSKYGAAVRSIVLNDHYVSPTAAKKPQKKIYDYYPIVPYFADHSARGSTFGLVLEGRGKNRFAKAIDDVHASIREGESIARPLQASGVFDDILDDGELLGLTPLDTRTLAPTPCPARLWSARRPSWRLAATANFWPAWTWTSPTAASRASSTG